MCCFAYCRCGVKGFLSFYGIKTHQNYNKNYNKNNGLLQLCVVCLYKKHCSHQLHANQMNLYGVNKAKTMRPELQLGL